jgi:membrane associated rhomboid family serine protease
MFLPFHDDNPTERTPVVTVALIAINLVCFLAVRRMPSMQQQEVTYRWGFMPKRIAQLADPNLVIEVPVSTGEAVFRRHGGWVPVQEKLRLTANRREILASLLTCMFLHGGWMHLIGNMWFLWLFGNNVEDRLGPLLFCVLYLVGGLLGSGCHWIRNPASLTPVIGASGAVATVLGAYAITWPWARVHTLVFLFVFVTVIDLPALLVLGSWFLIQLWEGTREAVAQNVAWWAHVGGFVAGAVLVPAFSAALGAGRRYRPARPTEDSW